LKNNPESEQYQADLERQDATALRKRAAEDAVKDADSYVSKSRPQRGKVAGPHSFGLVLDLLSPTLEGAKVGSQDGIDGLLIHSGDIRSRLVLSDELLEISLAAEVEALMAGPIKLFHVQTLAPWVEQVYPGKA
jgi:hypothetical protein